MYLLKFNYNLDNNLKNIKLIKMETSKQELELYRLLLNEFGCNFKSCMPSFGNLLWQLIINEAWKDKKIHCFIAIYDGNGLVLGIAEENEPGYYNTHVYFNDGITHDKATELLLKLNELMFGLSPITTGVIITSSILSSIRKDPKLLKTDKNENI